jgi:hypothetical protein
MGWSAIFYISACRALTLLHEAAMSTARPDSDAFCISISRHHADDRHLADPVGGIDHERRVRESLPDAKRDQHGIQRVISTMIYKIASRPRFPTILQHGDRPFQQPCQFLLLVAVNTFARRVSDTSLW